MVFMIPNGGYMNRKGCNSYHETNFIFLNETHFFKPPVFEEKMTVIKICHFSPLVCLVSSLNNLVTHHYLHF